MKSRSRLVIFYSLSAIFSLGCTQTPPAEGLATTCEIAGCPAGDWCQTCYKNTNYDQNRNILTCNDGTVETWCQTTIEGDQAWDQFAKVTCKSGWVSNVGGDLVCQCQNNEGDICSTTNPKMACCYPLKCEVVDPTAPDPQMVCVNG